MVDVTFVSTNAGKFREAKAILRPFGVDLRWRRRSMVEPQIDDLAEIARAKLREVRDVPGTFWSRTRGCSSPRSTASPVSTLRTSSPLGGSTRSSSSSGIATGGRISGRWPRSGGAAGFGPSPERFEGSIARRPAGRNGFGYDPIFVPTGWTRTFAEAPPEAKDKISHRASAIRKVGRFLSRGKPAAAGGG